MANRIDPHSAEHAARKLLDDRIAAVRNLARVRQNRDDKRDELLQAEREDAVAYVAAQRAGWNVEELRKVGFSEPTVRRPGRPRRREKRVVEEAEAHSPAAS